MTCHPFGMIMCICFSYIFSLNRFFIPFVLCSTEPMSNVDFLVFLLFSMQTMSLGLVLSACSCLGSVYELCLGWKCPSSVRLFGRWSLLTVRVPFYVNAEPAEGHSFLRGLTFLALDGDKSHNFKIFGKAGRI